MSWDLAFFRTLHDEGKVRILWVGNPAFEIRAERGLRELWILLLCQNKVVEVIESLNTVIAPENVQSILHDLACVAESG